MTVRVANKIAVVIGGASGIGWASAELLAREGAIVVVADIDAGKAADRARELGGRASSRSVDVTDEESVRSLFEHTVAEVGSVDITVNCVGVNLPGFITELDGETWRRTVDICLTGGFFVIKHAARVMGVGGAIVSITSLNARQAAAGFAGYCSAKAGLVMLTEVAALELGGRGIRVNAVSPGLVETPLVEGLTSVPIIQEDFTENTPLGRNGLPRDVAEAVLYLASDASSWTTGEVMDVNGGAHLRRYPDVMKHIVALS
ncbi:SDR family NAD(P)-dependent oxidoreductase [Rhodococcus qingshengii]|uniref:SDR family NAD(P)-dependent oxidoreductase n=1 Tax=Rhodococcus qingshengii TaxID=334542 RepID=UPI002108AD83|nr:SDR family oxidoreductase [Rhodococcus qingshengii]MCQ4152520.1 SDR family oxidoreductase [Rhodococcus qingshengii]